MISYTQACKKAKECWDEVDYCTEHPGAYVFSKKDDLSFGGNSPVVVLKETGECWNYTAFLDEDYDLDVISEHYI